MRCSISIWWSFLSFPSRCSRRFRSIQSTDRRATSAINSVNNIALCVFKQKLHYNVIKEFYDYCSFIFIVIALSLALLHSKLHTFDTKNETLLIFEWKLCHLWIKLCDLCMKFSILWMKSLSSLFPNIVHIQFKLSAKLFPIGSHIYINYLAKFSSQISHRFNSSFLLPCHTDSRARKMQITSPETS